MSDAFIEGYSDGVASTVSGDMTPFSRALEHLVPAVAIASDSKVDLIEAPFDGWVAVVNFVPAAAIVGADTNSRTVSLVNKGQAGTGTTVVTSKSFNAASGTTAAAVALPLAVPAVPQLSPTGVWSYAYPQSPLPLLKKGDVLEWQSNHLGTGIADPGGMVHLVIRRSPASYPG